MLVKNIERHGIIAEILFEAQKKGILLEYVERQVIDRLGQSGANQGIIALTAAKEYADLDELLEIPAKINQNAFFIILDGLEDPHNLGAIIRTADATGAHGVIVRERRAVGLTAVVEKPLYRRLKESAQREGISMSTRVRDLLIQALEWEEDRFWVREADRRMKTFDRRKALSHEQVWGKRK